MHEIELGKNKRMSFSRIPEKLELPNLIEVQKDSYEWFVRDGLREVFRDVSPITDYTGNLILEFLDYSLTILQNVKKEMRHTQLRFV